MNQSVKDIHAHLLLEMHYCISHSPLNKAFIQYYISHSLKQRGSDRACYSWEQHYIMGLKHFPHVLLLTFSKYSTQQFCFKWFFFFLLTTASKDTEQHDVVVVFRTVEMVIGIICKIIFCAWLLLKTSLQSYYTFTYT